MLSWLSWENPVAIWWVLLSSAGLLNITFWIWTRFYAYRNQSIFSVKQGWSNPRNIIWFSALYVFVCAFRSIMPRADVQRICLFDTWFSSVLVGRSVATVAELAFVIQWMIVLKFLSEQTSSRMGLKISKIIVPIIFTAECFSWYAVITTHYLGNSVEESLWGVTYALILIAILGLMPKLKGALKLAAGFTVVGCAFYILFMATVDVPMYIGRLIADTRAQKPLLGLLAGFHDLNTRWVVTHDIQDWKTEIPWQTLYFTFAVWVSLALFYIPFTRERLQKYLVVRDPK